MARIIIIDNNVLFREGLTHLLQEEPGIAVVGETNTIGETLHAFHPVDPTLFIVDADLPDLDEYKGIRLLRAQYPRAQVILLCARHSDTQLLNAVRNGARGYLLKHISVHKLVASIHAMDRGEAAIPRAFMGRLLDEFFQFPTVQEEDHIHLLTPREIDVLRELGHGRSNRQIAEQLDIAENTVKVHVHNILEKLNLRNRRQVARFARNQYTSSAYFQNCIPEVVPSTRALQYIN